MSIDGHKKVVAIVTLFLFLIGINGCASHSRPADAADPTTAATTIEQGPVLPTLELPVPSDTATQEYLGITGSGPFKITDIKAEVLIIEVFNMYCPHCQKDAPNVNKLYEKLQKEKK